MIPILAVLAALTNPVQPRERVFEATYTATLTDIPSHAATMTVWIPLPVTRDGQKITDVEIDSPYNWHRAKEAIYGDAYAYATIARPANGTFSVRVHFKGIRREITSTSLPETKASHDELRRALQADRLVTLSPRIRKLAAGLTAGKTTPTAKARAIYDHLLATMTYDKTVPGWGNGDTERACDIRKGNCTDFHSLFISLARASGIPARFVIGFPMPENGGVVTGYHCWAEFYVAGRGWIPVDPSEASKSNDPGRREYLFGNVDPDRVQFTMGRDLVLHPATATPLNYFIYPHAEAEGDSVGVPSIALEVRDLPERTEADAR